MGTKSATLGSGGLDPSDQNKLDNATSAATVSTLALRDASGRFKVTDPSAADDVATKGSCAAAIAAADPTPDLLDWAVNGQSAAIARYNNGSAYTLGTEWVVHQRIATFVRRVLGVKARLAVSGSETYAFFLWDFAGTLHETKSVTASADGEYSITFNTPFQPLLNAPFRVGYCNTTNPTFYTRIATATFGRDFNTAIVSGGVRCTAAVYYVLGASTRPTTSSGSERYPVAPVFEVL